MTRQCGQEIGGSLDRPCEMRFAGSMATFELSVKELGLPADWSGYGFLVLDMVWSRRQPFRP